MSKNAILDRVFPVRSSAVLALRAPQTTSDAATFEALATEANEVARAFGRAPAAKRWEAFACALEIVRRLLEWEHASMTAAVDADRFLRAARLRLKQLRERPELDGFADEVVQALSAIEGEIGFSGIPSLRHRVAVIPMPVAVYADPVPQRPDWAEKRQKPQSERPPDLTVAFIEFKINGVMAERIQSLQPREKHDLDIAVRVSRWPDAATALVLTPLSLDPTSTFDLPTFRFTRPSNDPPYFFQQRGRMILHSSQSLKARLSEFHYAAEFEPVIIEQPVSIAGQRTLRLDGSGSDRQPITGYRGIDTKLIGLRDQLRLEPLITEEDLEQFLMVLVPLANLMGQSVQDNKFPAVISEAEFQKQVRERLRQEPTTGSRLEEQAHAAGGRTDLSLWGVRIELKSEPNKKLMPDDCKHYAAQPASYAVGTNRRVAVLCVLDCSPKKEGPFPVEDGLFIFPIDTGTSPVYIACILIQANLARPSDLSH